MKVQHTEEQLPVDAAAFERLLVLLDPSSEDGETGAVLASTMVGQAGHVELAVAMNGPETWALKAYAESEEISLKEAAWIYLDQAALRLGGKSVGTTTVEGLDLAPELVQAAEAAGAEALVLPALMAARVMASKQSWAGLALPVVVAPAQAA